MASSDVKSCDHMRAIIADSQERCSNYKRRGGCFASSQVMEVRRISDE
jgi:hypothetical protein